MCAHLHVCVCVYLWGLPLYWGVVEDAITQIIQPILSLLPGSFLS